MGSDIKVLSSIKGRKLLSGLKGLAKKSVLDGGVSLSNQRYSTSGYLAKHN